jgi:hypothetical protein
MLRAWLALIVFLLTGVASAHAASPELESWILNWNGSTGYSGLPADVQRIQYSANNVYVNSSDIPLYSIGPWPTDPNTPTNQNFLFRIPRAPVENLGTKTATPLGVIGFWINGVAIFNALDAMSYLNQNVWHQNAVVVEAESFDACLGHPAPGGVYHHHQHPVCLDPADSTQHSPIFGYAFDGFPVYGPYGYALPDGNGGVARMRSSYRLRSITQRHTLPNGTVLAPSQYGPDVSPTYPLGYYVEDFEYVSGLGDLDAYNGRFAVTPEYPSGTYAYFVTMDATGASAYPYVVGPQYYGVVAADNISSHQHVTISEAVQDYVPSWVGIPESLPLANAGIWSAPNPARGAVTLVFSLARPSRVRADLIDVSGHVVRTLVDGERPQGVQLVRADLSRLAPGVYWFEVRGDAFERRCKAIVLR